METKKINRLMLGIYVFYIAVVVVIGVMGDKLRMGNILSMALGEIILAIPAAVYLLCYKFGKDKSKINPVQTQEELPADENVGEAPKPESSKKRSLRERLGYNKIKWSTLLWILLFTWLSMPLTTLINAISMLFVENTVVSAAGTILSISFPVMLFLMAVLPACVEELIYRGIAYRGYRKSGTKFAAIMLSALMFGLMHMNLNQAMYAFVLGILLALLFEATGSLFAPMLFHFVYNAQSVCMMFLVDAMDPGVYSDAAALATEQNEMFSVIAVYLVIAAITTPLAMCVLYKISKNEERKKELLECLPFKQKGKKHLVTVSAVLAIMVAVGYIAFEMIVTAKMK